MAYDFVPASSQRFYATLDAMNVPMTISAWAYPDSLATTAITAVGVSSASDRSQLIATSNTSFAANTAGTSNQLSTKAAQLTTWQQVVAVFSSATSRTIYIDGAAGTTNTTSSTVANADSVNIGARISSGSPGAYFDGRIAEVAVWSVALSADDIASLSKGFKPRQVRPQSLVFYSPLVRDVIDVRGASITTAGSPSLISHPRVYSA